MARRKGSSRPVDIRDVHVIKHGDVFLLCNRFGDLPKDNDAALGLYFRDTRFLSRMEIWIDRTQPVFLHSESDRNYSMVVEATLPIQSLDPSGRTVHKNLSLLRRRWIDNGMRETIEIHNYGVARQKIRVEIAFDADFLDVFEVRGFSRTARGTATEPVVGDRSVTLGYEGTDAMLRSLELRFDPKPAKLGANGARFDVVVDPQSNASISIAAIPRVGSEEPQSEDLDALEAGYTEWRESCTRFRTSHALLQRHLDRTVLDLRMLQHDGTAGPVLDAGVPWFSALFGRDSLIAAYQSLAVNPDLAMATLAALAENQGVDEVEWTEEEPGKILHELRRGELAAAGEIPHTPYFGTIDATPLWLVVFGHVWQWTGDIAFAERWWPNALRALEWIDRYGDFDGDGYVEYRKRSPGGLDNQGWKDSHDAIVHRDGSLAEGPIALVEVQGYVYDARRRMADLARSLGYGDVAADLDERADALRKRFNEDFWMDDVGYYALALDGGKRQVGSITSNPGHGLWSGIIDDTRVDSVVDVLMSEKMSTGWGIRTLSSKNPGYDPVGYHTGTVWPHDCALIAHGMKLAGRPDAAITVIDRLAAAASFLRDGRFPELFCGFTRDEVRVPVEYPVACRPQAWSAGAGLLMASTYLGLRPDAPGGRLDIVQPALPAWVDSQDVLGLRVGEATVDLSFRRQDGITGCQVVDRTGDVEVAVRY